MKTIKLLFGIIVLLIIASPVYPQMEIDSLILKEIKSVSISDVDFNKFNNMIISDIERQALLAYIQKDYGKAAQYYLYIVKNNIDDATSYYNLSCCYARLNLPELAGYFLIMSVNSGYNNIEKIKNEESFKLIMGNSYFKNVIDQVYVYGKNFGKTIYAEAKVLIKSKVMLPENFDPNKNYSLLIGLHGYGGTAENFSKIYNFIHSDNYIFVVPEAPYLKNNDGGNKYLEFSWDFHGNDNELWKKSDPEVFNYIMNVLDYMNTNYKISKNYLLGFSQGVSYAYGTAMKYPEKIDGVIAFAGRLPDPKEYPWFISEEDMEKGSGLKVFITHGKEDEAINYKQSLDAKKRLLKYGYNVGLFLFAGGHSVTKEALNEALSWLEKENK